MAAISADYHVHSSFSADCDSPMEAQIEAAIAAGLSSICFTEHVDLDSPYLNAPPDDRIDFRLDEVSYFDRAKILKTVYQDRIHLHFGVEIGLNSSMTDRILAYLRAHPDFDFVIGSTHSSRGMDPYYDSFFAAPGVPAGPGNAVRDFDPFRIYFEDALQNLISLYDRCDAPHSQVSLSDCSDVSQNQVSLPDCKNGVPPIDSYAHLDYVLRYGPLCADGSTPERTPGFYYSKYRDIIDEMLLILIREGICLELNTSRLRRGFPEANPGKAILLRYKELGGDMITIGSDAHSPDGIACCFDKARELLLSCGFRYYATFSGRQRDMHLL